MGETLTIEEIEARYAPFWVLIGEPETDDQQHLLGGRVLWTSTNSEELYLKAIELGLDRIAVRYLGTWPEDMVFFLNPHSTIVERHEPKRPCPIPLDGIRSMPMMARSRRL